jgi:hypothetical protein
LLVWPHLKSKFNQPTKQGSELPIKELRPKQRNGFGNGASSLQSFSSLISPTSKLHEGKISAAAGMVYGGSCSLGLAVDS